MAVFWTGLFRFNRQFHWKQIKEDIPQTLEGVKTRVSNNDELAKGFTGPEDGLCR